MSAVVEVTRKGRIAVVTMRSAPVNAISEPWIAAWLQVLAELEADDAISVVHLRSALPVFSAGGDLKEMRERMEARDPGARMRDRIVRIQALYRRLEQLRAVVVTEIGGDCLGGGAELALATDIRIMAASARFGLPEVRLGLFPACGGTQRLARLCGTAAAKRLILGAEIIDAPTALALGLVQSVVAADAIADAAAAWCQQLASCPAQALRAAKTSIEAYGTPGVDGYAVECEQSAGLLSDPETRQRVSAFLDRRGQASVHGERR